jgi:hypothetical protein
MEVKMRLCFCRLILAILVIVFAWWNPGFAKIALTVIGALLAILALTNACCCRPKCCEEKTEEKTD